MLSTRLVTGALRAGDWKGPLDSCGCINYSLPFPHQPLRTPALNWIFLFLISEGNKPPDIPWVDTTAQQRGMEERNKRVPITILKIVFKTASIWSFSDHLVISLSLSTCYIFVVCHNLFAKYRNNFQPGITSLKEDLCSILLGHLPSGIKLI